MAVAEKTPGCVDSGAYNCHGSDVRLLAVVAVRMILGSWVDPWDLGPSHLQNVTVKKVHAVAVWKWDMKDDCCGICRMAFETCCPNCKVAGDDCPPGAPLAAKHVW